MMIKAPSNNTSLDGAFLVFYILSEGCTTIRLNGCKPAHKPEKASGPFSTATLIKCFNE